MKFPISNDALDDRIAFVGTAGSGKTYNACAAVERLLERKARVVIIDPLGAWWGLRLSADGKKPSPFPVVIFGGRHGDLPLTEHAGALIGALAKTITDRISDSAVEARRELQNFLRENPDAMHYDTWREAYISGAKP